MKTCLDLTGKSSYAITFLFFLIFCYCSSSSQAQCTGSNVITDPDEFQWTYHPVSPNNPEPYYSGTMEVGEATFNFNGQTFITRAYRQQGSTYSIPGPTLKMTPGNKYVLSVHNLLPYEPINPAHNVYKDPNVVNLHTHGLHISGMSPGDDVTRSFEGGRGGDFVYDIPADHMGGTFWYHAHHHGSTTLQVSGGMFGMIVIDDSNDGIPAPVAAMEEKLLMIGKIDPTAAGLGGDVLMGGSLSSAIVTVNGKMGGQICMPANTWQHWRVAIGDPMAMLRDLEFGPECEVKVLARDGVWRTVAPKDLPTNTLKLTGASRADFAIRTTGNSWVKMNGNTIATITASGTSDPNPHPYDVDGVSQWSANRPSYLRDLRNEPIVNTESISMGARTVNGSKYDHHMPNITLPTTDVQEWSLSGNVRHPFHLHVYHVQALVDDRDFEAGEYYDVVASQMDVRFDLNAATTTPYSGRTIMHCHILEHEDQGAMGWLNVVGGEGAPTFPVDSLGTTSYSAYYVIGGSSLPPADPGNLSASATSSSSIDLSWDDNSSDEDGFTIERSSDGVNFSAIASVPANQSTYTDNGLSASSTYYYRVDAYNANGNSAYSNIASATTQSGGGGGNGVVMHVENISVSQQPTGRNKLLAVADVLILDATGSPVANATVDGNFTGPTSGTASGQTDAQGMVRFNSRSTRSSNNGTWCFEVSNVSLTGSTYDNAANVMTQACDDGSAARTASKSMPALSGKLLSVYPNPFNHSTQIALHLESSANLTIEVHSVLGKKVGTIASQQFDKGSHLLNWKPENLESGIYFIQVYGEDLLSVQKIMLIK